MEGTYILRLEVAMDDAASVAVVQGLNQLLQDPPGLFLRQPTVRLHMPAKPHMTCRVFCRSLECQYN